jgi:hypothetical protein
MCRFADHSRCSSSGMLDHAGARSAILWLVG